jgi:hypothetical protein
MASQRGAPGAEISHRHRTTTNHGGRYAEMPDMYALDDDFSDRPGDAGCFLEAPMTGARALSPVLACVLASALALAGPAIAKVVDGVDFPDRVDVAGVSLTRNGIGARTALFMRFYLAALYVEKVGTDAGALLAPERPRQVRLAIVKEVTRQRFQDAAREGFEKNTPSPSASLIERENRFLALMPGLVPGDALTFSYEPGIGTRIEGNKVKSIVIPGKDFADALMSIWMGPHPVDDDLKAGLLGKASL